MTWQELAGPRQLEDMAFAIRLLMQWQESTYQLPLLENPNAFYREKEKIAALLVDNHLGKLARKVRMLGGQTGLDTEAFMDEWSEITFYTSLWSQFENLPDGLKINLIYQSGPNITKKHLSRQKPFTDHFLVTGIRFATEERLLRRSVYFYARQHKRFHLLLEYSFDKRPFDRLYHVGEVYHGEVVAYPFPGSLRISPGYWKMEHSHAGLFGEMMGSSIEKAVHSYKSVLKINPFCEPYPVLVELQTVYEKDKWQVTDSMGNRVRMAAVNQDQMALFYAASFKRMLLAVALLSKEGILPLSYYNGEYLVDLREGGQSLESRV